MNYFGKRSLSSVVSGIVNVSWYLLLIASVLAPLAAGAAIFFSTPTGESYIAENMKTTCEVESSAPVSCGGTAQDIEDWNRFKSTPLGLKLFMLPYLEAVIIMMLIMTRKARRLFDNFKNEIVFNRSNVELLSTISKLNLGFGVLTFSLTTMLLSVVLFLLCEIIKSGTVLQEEHDLTI